MRREAWSAILGGMVGSAFVLLATTTVPALQAQQAPASTGSTKVMEDVAARQQEILEGQQALAKDVRALIADVKEIRQSVEFIRKRSRHF